VIKDRSVELPSNTWIPAMYMNRNLHLVFTIACYVHREKRHPADAGMMEGFCWFFLMTYWFLSNWMVTWY